jgi:glucose/arabinose dehydrogenase
MRKILLFAAPAALLASFALLAWQTQPQLPPPYHTPSVTNRARVIDRPAGAELGLPEGFTVEEFASGFQRPRFMTLGPSNEILLSDSMNNGSVWVLGPQSQPGKAGEKREIIKNLDRPYGLALYQDWLFVGETTSLKRYKYNAKTMTAGPGEEIFEMKEFGSGHWTRSLLLDAKNQKIYVGIGSRSNVDAGEPELRAAVVRLSLDGKSREVYASGTRNPIGLRFYPGSQTVWAAVQERDGLGDDLVPDYFTSLKQGGFYGWPYAYIGPNEDPRRKGEKPDLVKSTIIPDVPLGAHVAVLDALFYTGKQFPKQYQGGAFLAFHGSWNRSKRVGYNVSFIPFKDGKPQGAPQPFLSGWMLAPDEVEVWGRPVGLLQMPDGSLLVSDDGGNKIWRVSYKG